VWIPISILVVAAISAAVFLARSASTDNGAVAGTTARSTPSKDPRENIWVPHALAPYLHRIDPACWSAWIGGLVPLQRMKAYSELAGLRFVQHTIALRVPLSDSPPIGLTDAPQGTPQAGIIGAEAFTWPVKDLIRYYRGESRPFEALRPDHPTPESLRKGTPAVFGRDLDLSCFPPCQFRSPEHRQAWVEHLSFYLMNRRPFLDEDYFLRKNANANKFAYEVLEYDDGVPYNVHYHPMGLASMWAYPYLASDANVAALFWWTCVHLASLSWIPAGGVPGPKTELGQAAQKTVAAALAMEVAPSPDYNPFADVLKITSPAAQGMMTGGAPGAVAGMVSAGVNVAKNLANQLKGPQQLVQWGAESWQPVAYPKRAIGSAPPYLVNEKTAMPAQDPADVKILTASLLAGGKIVPVDGQMSISTPGGKPLIQASGIIK
jgi:hypothetical protein